MNEKQRVYKKNRTNRRVRKIPYEGVNKRKGLGRRKHEVVSYYVYLGAIAFAISVIAIVFYAIIF